MSKRWGLASTLVVTTVAVAAVASVAVTHSTTTTPTRVADQADVAAGQADPPASFWGNTRDIPAAKRVLEVEIINRTNGHFTNGQVYWSFGGTEKSIAQQRYIDMPANSAGRMYFYLGSRASKYYDFIEFTVGQGFINVDTTRVDRFGLKLALLAHGHNGSTQEVGEDYATFQQSRAATFTAFEKFVPAPFKQLATVDAPYGIPSPGNDPAFQPGGADAAYYTGYAPTGVSTADVFGCAGPLSDNPPLCAALNRHVAVGESDPADFYKKAPANYYADFWHSVAIGGKQYGFPYDDDGGQSSDISVTNPEYMIVAVGW
jgi:hypothetical protein